MSGVQLSHVQKHYGALNVLHGVSLDIAEGEFVVLVGPSGCGKSTLLRMIAGLEEISAGKVSIGGRIVNDLAPKERDIAMVFQSYALYPHMTVGDNMSFALKLKGVPKDERERKVRLAASILGLDALLDRYPRNLSGGQRQRVAMGRAIVRDPQVFLFDEPLSNLDAKLRVAMRAEIKELHQKLRVTTIYVTHDQIEAMTMADRIVVMRDGQVEQIGAPLDLYENPINLFVASFIGSPAMNILDGRVLRGREQAIELGNGFLLRTTHLPAGDVAGVKVGFRPEHIRLVERGLSAKVVIVEPTGSETHALLRVDGQDIVAVFRGKWTAKPGDMIAIDVDPADVLLFDRETGVRL